MDEETALNAPAAGSSTDAATTDAPMSKSAMKKAARRAKFEAARPEKRAAERARRRDRAHYLSEGYAAGTLSPEDAALVERQREQKRARKLASRGADSASVFPAGVIVDLEFDDLMTDQEITSMHSQLGYVYSCNRTAARPFAAVLHTGFSPVNAPRLWSKMGKAQWHRWARMWFTAEGVGEVGKRLGKAPEEVEELDTPAPAEAPAASTSEVSPDTPYGELVQHLATSLPSTIPPTHKLVYLSADAEEELSTLAEDEVYVLGGIVDRNRHKMLCQNKAEGLSIRTARLPIGTYLANLPTRKVLTVNQVFEILSKYVELQDWAAAFEAVIPQRKYFNGKEEKKKAAKGGAEGGKEAGEGDDEEEEEAEQNEDETMDTPTAAAAAAPLYEEEAMNG